MPSAEPGIEATERSGLLALARQRVTPTAWIVVASLAIAAFGLALARYIGLEVSGRTIIFIHLFLSDEPSAAWLAVALIGFALVAARRVPLVRLDAALDRLSADPRAFIAAVTAVCAVAAVVVYQAYPLSMDEYAPVFQAGAFARGELGGKVPPALISRVMPAIPWFLEASSSGQLISAYWPGFALLLTPFTLLHCPWLLNPLIGGATLLVLWRLARELWPGTQAPGWTVLFAAASPAFLVNAISFYSMAAHLLASSAYALLLLRLTPRRLIAAGALGSFALVLHNPAPHALFALPWIAWVALQPRRLRNLSLLALGYLPGTVLLGGGWLWVRNQLGHASAGSHSLRELALMMWRLAFSAPSASLIEIRLMNFVELALWAAPLLVPLACVGGWKRRGDRAVVLLALSAAATMLGYVFVPYDQGHGWGYRYFHSTWLVLPLFAAAAMQSADALLRRLAAVTALGSLLLGTALRFAQVHSVIAEQRQQLPGDPEPRGFEVVLVRADRGYYSIDLVQNDPFLEGRRWILLSRGPAEDEEFMRASFPHPRIVARNEVATVWQVE